MALQTAQDAKPNPFSGPHSSTFFGTWFGKLLFGGATLCSACISFQAGYPRSAVLSVLLALFIILDPLRIRWWVATGGCARGFVSCRSLLVRRNQCVLMQLCCPADQVSADACVFKCFHASLPIILLRTPSPGLQVTAVLERRRREQQVGLHLPAAQQGHARQG